MSPLAAASGTPRISSRSHFSIHHAHDARCFMSEPDYIVFVVDHDRSVLHALGRLMRSVGLHCGLFSSAHDFLQTKRADVSSRLVLDVSLPGKNALDFQLELTERNIHIPIIFFITVHGDIPMSVRAMKAGAVDFLAKPFPEQDLLDAIQLAWERDRVTRRQEAELALLHEHLESLTPGEREVLPRLVSGFPNQQKSRRARNQRRRRQGPSQPTEAKDGRKLLARAGRDGREIGNSVQIGLNPMTDQSKADLHLSSIDSPRTNCYFCGYRASYRTRFDSIFQAPFPRREIVLDALAVAFDSRWDEAEGLPPANSFSALSRRQSQQISPGTARQACMPRVFLYVD